MAPNLIGGQKWILNPNDPVASQHFTSMLEKFQLAARFNSLPDLLETVEGLGPIAYRKSNTQLGKETFNYINNEDPDIITNDLSIDGFGSKPGYKHDEVVIGRNRFAVNYDDMRLQQAFQNNTDFLKHLYTMLTESQKKFKIRKHFGRSVACFAQNDLHRPNELVANPYIETKIKDFSDLMAEKIKNCALDKVTANASNRICRQRVIFGSDNIEALAEATLEKALSKLTKEKDGLTTRALLRAQITAASGGRMSSVTAGLEDPIQYPVLSEKKAPVDAGGEYIALMSPVTYSQLTEDPMFYSYFTRGLVVANQPQGIYNSRYMGTIHGVKLFMDPLLAHLDFILDIGGEKRQFGYVQFLGTQAFAHLEHGRPQIIHHHDEKKIFTQIEYREYTGSKALVIDSHHISGLKVERGILHGFYRLN